MKRSLWARLIALAVVVGLGVYYIAFDVLQYRIGAQPVPVTVMMPSAGGLYVGADVTYRGVNVGRVSSLDVKPTGVAVKLGINPGAHIPDNGLAYVHQLSSLGEQYLDFVPSRPSTHYIHSGTVVPASRVVLPIPIGTSLVDLGSLLRSVNQQDLQTVESFLTSAFVGTGPDLRQIIVTGQQLFQALVAAQPETVNLVVDGNTDLKTLQATDGDFGTFAHELNLLTGQLKASNSDLQALINNGAAASQQLDPFLASNNASITSLIANLGTDAGVSGQFQPAVQAMFQVLPIVANDLASVSSSSGVRGEITFNTSSPVCPYIPGAQMPGPTQRVANATLTNGCSSSAPGMLERGANNAP
ncbi:MAG: MCE family protein [Acidimicrobiaceae bacterium]|nr:MCE family protein [Acidimicrobiaceae bacterium]